MPWSVSDWRRTGPPSTRDRRRRQLAPAHAAQRPSRVAVPGHRLSHRVATALPRFTEPAEPEPDEAEPPPEEPRVTTARSRRASGFRVPQEGSIPLISTRYGGKMF